MKSICSSRKVKWVKNNSSRRLSSFKSKDKAHVEAKLIRQLRLILFIKTLRIHWEKKQRHQLELSAWNSKLLLKMMSRLQNDNQRSLTKMHQLGELINKSLRTKTMTLIFSRKSRMIPMRWTKIWLLNQAHRKLVIKKPIQRLTLIL